MLLCALCVVPSASSFLFLLQQTETPDWCKPLPRPEYKSLERVAISDPWFEVTKLRPTPSPFTNRTKRGSQSPTSSSQGEGFALRHRHGHPATSASWSRDHGSPCHRPNSHTHNDHVGGNWQFDTIYSMDTDFSRQNAKGSPPTLRMNSRRVRFAVNCPRALTRKRIAPKPGTSPSMSMTATSSTSQSNARNHLPLPATRRRHLPLRPRGRPLFTGDNLLSRRHLALSPRKPTSMPTQNPSPVWRPLRRK